MTFSEFESAYFNFDIAFQRLLEDLSLLDTFSMDTVEVSFEDKLVQLNWRDSHKIFEVTDVAQKVSKLQELLPQAQEFHTQLLGGSYHKLSPTQKQDTINWLVNKLNFIFMEG